MSKLKMKAVVMAAFQILTASAARKSLSNSNSTLVIAAEWRDSTVTPSELTVGEVNELEWSLRLPIGQ